VIIRTIHPTNNVQLARVVEEMKRLGAPTVQVLDCGDYFFAFEGTHRIEAARLLRLPVTLKIVAPEVVLDVKEMDIAVNFDSPREMSAHEAVAGLHGACNGYYEVKEGGIVELVKPASYPPVEGPF
jgi:hypothetical protein